MSQLLPRETVTFELVRGYAVPCQPWPQKFVVSRSLIMRDAVELRPLTLTGLVKGVTQNLVTMTWWRVLYALRLLGFLTTPQNCVLSLHDLTWRFWRYQDVRRFRWVRTLSRLIERVRTVAT